MGIEYHCKFKEILSSKNVKEIFPNGFENTVLAEIEPGRDHYKCDHCLMLVLEESNSKVHYCSNQAVLEKELKANLVSLLSYIQSQLAKEQSR